MRKVVQPLAKRALIPLRVTAVTLGKDSRKAMEDIIEIAKSLKDSCSLIKGITQTIENKREEQRGGFLDMLLSTLGASYLGNILAGKGFNRVGDGAASPKL